LKEIEINRDLPLFSNKVSLAPIEQRERVEENFPSKHPILSILIKYNNIKFSGIFILKEQEVLK